MNYRRLLLTSVGVAIAVPVLAQQEPAATELAAIPAGCDSNFAKGVAPGAKCLMPWTERK